MTSHFLLQRIYLIQGLNLHLLLGRQILYHQSHQESPTSIKQGLKKSFGTKKKKKKEIQREEGRREEKRQEEGKRMECTWSMYSGSPEKKL